jgi:hypothetical protein
MSFRANTIRHTAHGRYGVNSVCREKETDGLAGLNFRAAKPSFQPGDSVAMTRRSSVAETGLTKCTTNPADWDLRMSSSMP